VSDLRELMFWPMLALCLWGISMIVWGVATWSKGGPANVRRGLWVASGMGIFLLEGVVAASTRLAIIGPALIVLAVWYIQQKRGRWPAEKRSETGR